MKLIVATLFCGLLLAETATFQFSVFRNKITRDEAGQLKIGEAGVSYRSDNGKTSFSLAFTDIRKVDVSRPGQIEIETYDVKKRTLGRNEVLVFRLKDGSSNDTLARFLAEHMKRPVVGAYGLPDTDASRIPAYQRGHLGGAHGTLVIGVDGIQFVSGSPGKSRTWLYRDIETIGAADPFHFRLTSYAETFAFDLKERLPEEAWRRAWQQVYGRPHS